jgi:integrase
MHSSHLLREGARPEVVRDILGHAKIDATQNVYGKSWWEEPGFGSYGLVRG